MFTNLTYKYIAHVTNISCGLLRFCMVYIKPETRNFYAWCRKYIIECICHFYIVATTTFLYIFDKFKLIACLKHLMQKYAGTFV